MTARLDDVDEQLRALGMVPVGALARSGQRSFHGVLDGQDVEVRIGGEPSGRARAVLEAVLAPALDLGLRIRTASRGVLLTVGKLGGAFAAAHDVDGDEPARVKALLDEAVVAGLEALGDRGHLEVDDVSIRLGPTVDLLEVAELASTLGRVAALLMTRARSLPAASPLAAPEAAWRPVAAAAGLTMTTTPLAMQGARISATTRRTGRLAFVSTAWVGHPRASELGIALRRTRVGDPVEAAAHAVQVGDAAFDRLFAVTTRDGAAPAQLLDAPVREALSALALIGEVQLDETGLVLGDAAPADVPRALDLMRRVLDGSVDNLRTATGPYR
jgi:hypothetical protein